MELQVRNKYFDKVEGMGDIQLSAAFDLDNLNITLETYSMPQQCFTLSFLEVELR